MRVVHFFHSNGNQGGDSLADVINLAIAQAQSGYDIGFIYLDEGPARILNDTLVKAKKFCKLGVKRIAINKKNAATKIATRLLAYKSASNFAQEMNSDFLHGHGTQGGQLARHVHKILAHKNMRTICIYSPHEPASNSLFTNWPFSTPEEKLWPHTQGIIFESAYCQANYYKRHGRLPCANRIIYSGLAAAEFSPRQIIDMATDFLYVGPMTRQQGGNILIKALARMKRSHTTDALMIGSGPQEKEFRAQVDRYGLSHKIFFNNPVSANTAFLKGGCLVLPAITSSIPTIALRAGAAGVPMILTDIAAIREMIGDVKMPLIAPNDTRALQEQLTQYLANPQLFLGRAAILKKRLAKQFTLARMKNEVEQFYSNCAKHR